MEPPEKVAAFLHIVRETIHTIQESGFLDEHLDLWSSAINRNDKMKSLLADVEDLSAMYKTDNLKLENPLSEPELNGEIRYMLTKRIHVLSQSDSILRRTYKDSLALLQNSHPVLNLQDSINELTSLEDAEDIKVLKDKKDSDNVNDMQHLTISDDKQQQQPSVNGENHLKLNPSNILHCSPSKTDPSKFEDYLDLDNFHRSKTSSSRKSKRHRHDEFYHDKYYPEKHARHHDKYHHDQKYSNEKHRRRSRSSRHKESRSSRRGRSRSRSPSKRRSYERETSKNRSGKVKKKQDNYLRQVSSEYHSKYDDLYKSYQNVVDDVSNKERDEFYKTKAN